MGFPDFKLLASELFSSGELAFEVLTAGILGSWPSRIFSSGVLGSELDGGCGKWIGESWLRMPGLLLQLRLNRLSSASFSCNIVSDWLISAQKLPELSVSSSSP